MVTEIGTIKGTLPYMSPEQARGNPDAIDSRSDVYALGVILYGMLTDTRPYDLSKKSLVEAVRVICEQSPASLGSRLSGVRRIDADLETIVGKALEKDAGRRYSSATELSGDIARYLTSQPILARPPSATYQLRKFAARNRTLVGGVVATFVVLVAGIVASTVLGLREASQRQAAVAAKNDLQTVVDFQARMLRDVDPSGMGQGLRQDLERRVGEAARLAGGSEAEIDGRLASFHRSLRDVNMTDAALRVLDEDVLGRAATSIDERFGDRPVIEARLRMSLSDTYRDLGFLDEAEIQCRRAREILDRELGPDHLDTLGAGLRLSWIYERQGRTPEAERVARDVFEASRRALGEDHELTTSALNRLAITYDYQGRYDEAFEAFQAVYESFRRSLGDDHLQTIWLLQNVGSVQVRRGRPAEAEPLLADAVARFRRVRGDDHRDTLWAMESHALALHRLGRLEHAEQVASDVETTRRRLLGDEHLETLVAMINLSAVHTSQGRLEEADGRLRNALERCRRTLGVDHRETLWAIEELGRNAMARGRPDEAEALYEELVATRSRALGAEHAATLQAMEALREARDEKIDD